MLVEQTVNETTVHVFAFNSHVRAMNVNDNSIRYVTIMVPITGNNWMYPIKQYVYLKLQVKTGQQKNIEVRKKSGEITAQRS